MEELEIGPEGPISDNEEEMRLMIPEFVLTLFVGPVKNLFAKNINFYYALFLSINSISSHSERDLDRPRLKRPLLRDLDRDADL